MKDYLEIRNTVTDDRETEVARIKDFLIEDKNPDSLANIRYNLWKDELKKFGEDRHRIQKVDVLKSMKIAIIRVQKLRTYEIKRKNGKTRKELVSMRFVYTWEKLEERWYLRNVTQIANQPN